MRARVLVICGALALTGCTDDSAIDGSYGLDLQNRDDGCSFWSAPFSGVSNALTLARYEETDEIQVVAVLDYAPGGDKLLIENLGFTGTIVNGELIAYSGTSVEIEDCNYFYSVEIRAQVRVNRFKNLLGQISHELEAPIPQLGCVDRCVSSQDLEGVKW